MFGFGERPRHTYCPDEDRRCVHGDDENCPALYCASRFDRCDAGCMNATTACEAGKCARRQEMQS